ncbi:MAG: RNA-guided endonuclease InsQ/TnpB family protein, partial [Candidatus Bilamarchaeum sp.]
MQMRSWKYRLYPKKNQHSVLEQQLCESKNLWNKLLEYIKDYYQTNTKFPTKGQLFKLVKDAKLYSQVAQNIAVRLYNSIQLMLKKRKLGQKAGFPRFKSIERVKSFTYPQSGFKLFNKDIQLSKIGKIEIRKHRDLVGEIKTLTIKREASGKWFAIFISEVNNNSRKNQGPIAGLDLGIEHFAYLSNGKIIENPRNLRKSAKKLATFQRRFSKKKKGSSNRLKAKRKVAILHEKIANQRRDFLHKTSKSLVNSYSLLCLEALNNKSLARGFLAKQVLDCSFAEFSNMLSYKAESAGCIVVFVNPA